MSSIATPVEVRAYLKDARYSAYKAREVLNLIRGKDATEAVNILRFTERGAAVSILKLLESAIANAGHNNDIPADELFVSACFADEGPTMRRFKARARGRGTRIRKRTSHITIILGRYVGEDLDRQRERLAARGAGSVDARASRARRVARSRSQVTTDADEATETPVEETLVETEAVETTEVEATAVETTEVEAVETAAEATEESPEAAAEPAGNESDEKDA